jgi:RNA polymerase sigma factor (sigma-70 family)
MVLGVCRRMLVDPHDAEDAFQATFFVLVRKAGSIRVDGSIGRWLFGVATRVAARARADARRRRGRERPGLDRLEIEAPETGRPAVDQADLRSILAEELGRLPARFQAPLLLCDLEGSSHEEAARRLGCAVGTVKSRLSRARARLRERLTRRGLAPPDLSIAVPLLPAALPRSLVEATTRAAQSLIANRMTTAAIVSTSVATLTEGVLRTMFLTKLKLAAVAMLLIITGSAALLGQASAQKTSGLQPIVPIPAAPANADPPRDDELDIVMLERAWVDAIPRRDAAIVNRIMADDFEGIDPVANIFTKATYMPDLRNGVFTNQPIELDEIKTRLFGDTAVVTSRIKISGYSTRGRMTNVYIKRQGRWQCVASHASGMAQSTCPGLDRQIGIRMPQPVGRTMDCTSCHDVIARVGIQLPRPEDARHPTAARPGDGQPAREEKIHVQTDAAGKITIDGEPVPAEKKALVERLRMVREKTGRKAMVLSADPDTPHTTAVLVFDAAHEAGLDIGFANLSGPLSSMKIRPRFECQVEKVRIKAGQTVRKGDPLLDLFSNELSEAKSHYEMARSQWNHDKRVLDYKAPLVQANTLPQKELLDAKNEETQSRLKLELAKDKLLVYGLSANAIENLDTEAGERRARLTLHASVDGTVLEVGAELGNLYDANSVLMVIVPTSSPKPAVP